MSDSDVSDATAVQSPAVAKTVERNLAMRNAVLISGSLLVTWSVALVIRLILPRRLGPDLFGQYSFADALAANGFGFILFGIDPYIQKEIPHRPGHASDFFGGTTVLRLFCSVAVLAVTAMLARSGNYSYEVVVTVVVFGIAQLCAVIASTCASLLYASRSVGKLSALNIGTKMLWAATIGLALQRHARLWAFACASILSEGLRMGVLLRLCRSTLGLKFRLDPGSTRLALASSFPFFLNQVGVALYAKIDVAIMGMLLTDTEVGYYSAATNISSVAMLMAPLMGWVLTPQIARAAPHPEEFRALMRRSLEWTLAAAVPLGLAMGLAADVIMHTVYGSRFDPGVGAMRTLGPMFIVVYVAILTSTGLQMSGKAWTVTKVTLASFVVNGALNLLCLRPALRYFGPGGAGIGAAFVWVFTELLVASTYVWILGSSVLDRRNVLAFAKTACASVCVVATHVATPQLGHARLALDLVVYVVLVLGTGAVPMSELAGIVKFMRENLRRRSAAGQTTE